MMDTCLASFVATTTLAVLTQSLVAQAGLPDPTFGGQGFVRINSGQTTSANGLAVQGDGRIVFVGRANGSPNPSWVIGRTLDDGSLDGTFGTGGITVIAGQASYAEADDVAIDPQGRIITTGRDANGFNVRRLLANGAIDTTFGTSGLVRTAIDQTAYSITLVLPPDASSPSGYAIVVGGYCLPHNGSARFALARYTAAGVLDTATFGP